MHFPKLLFLFTLLLSLFACESEESSSVEQDRIFARYELFYNQVEDVTDASATFFFGNENGTRLELTDPATVAFEGEELTWRPDPQAFYSRQFSDRIASGTFVYTNNEGQSFSNEVSLVPATRLPDDFTTATIGESFTLEWEGPALAAGEGVSFVFVPDANPLNVKVFGAVIEGEDRVVIPAGGLDGIDTGSATVFVDRRREMDLENGTSAGGKLVAQVRTGKEITIRLP